MAATMFVLPLELSGGRSLLESCAFMQTRQIDTIYRVNNTR